VDKDRRASVASLPVAFDAFYLEHRRCGEVAGGVEGDRVWMSCSCRKIARQGIE